MGLGTFAVYPQTKEMRSRACRAAKKVEKLVYLYPTPENKADFAKRLSSTGSIGWNLPNGMPTLSIICRSHLIRKAKVSNWVGHGHPWGLSYPKTLKKLGESWPSMFGPKAELHWNAGEIAGSDFAIYQIFRVTHSSWFTIINADDHSSCPKYLLSLSNLQTFPFNGNLPEIVSKTSSGRKFTKSIKCHITYFWSNQTSWGPKLIPLIASQGTIAQFWLWYSVTAQSIVIRYLFTAQIP